jgi:hypothetical protein
MTADPPAWLLADGRVVLEPHGAAPLGGALWLIAWRTEHAAGCPGRRGPVLAYGVDADRLARGDFDLPGLPGDRP